MGLSASPATPAVAATTLAATATATEPATSAVAAASAAPLSLPLALFRETVGPDVTERSLHRIRL